MGKPICIALLLVLGCASVAALEPEPLSANVATTEVASVAPLAAELPPSAQPASGPVEITEAVPTAVAATAPLPKEPPAPTDLWARMRRSFKLQSLEHPLVDSHVTRLRDSHYFMNRVERLRLYLPLVVAEVERRGLPGELALLPLVESALNCHAASPAAAIGCWQFLDGTARDMSLRISSLVDQRKDLLSSTRAALDYLEQLQSQTGGDWQLALAAYNWGIGRVLRISERATAKGQEVSFVAMSGSMPLETQNYVPQIEALKRLIVEGDADQLPDVPDQAFVVAVRLHYDIDVTLAARLAAISEAQLLKLNSAVKRPLILAAATPDLLLPVLAAERLVWALSAHKGPMASWKLVTTQGHNSVRQLAQTHRISEQSLRLVNHIPAGHKAGPGSTLLVPAGASSERHQRVNDSLIASARQHWLPDLVRLWLKARRKDTLPTIAKRVGMSPVSLTRWNPSLSPTRPLKPGTPILVMVPPEQQAQVLARSTGSAKAVVKAHPRGRESAQPANLARVASKKRSG